MNIKYDLRYNRNPNLDEILKTLETAKLESNMRKALQAKYDAMTTPLNALEKTMTPEQLKAVGHPAWARNDTVESLRMYFGISGNRASDDVEMTLANYHPHGQRTDDVFVTISQTNKMRRGENGHTRNEVTTNS